VNQRFGGAAVPDCNPDRSDVIEAAANV